MLKKIVMSVVAAAAALVVTVPAFASDGNGGLIANRGGHGSPGLAAWSDGNGGLIAN